jgi:hypothetical protein
MNRCGFEACGFADTAGQCENEHHGSSNAIHVARHFHGGRSLISIHACRGFQTLIYEQTLFSTCFFDFQPSKANLVSSWFWVSCELTGGFIVVLSVGWYSIHRSIDRKIADPPVTVAASTSDNQRSSHHKLSKSQESKAVSQLKTPERNRLHTNDQGG